MRQVLSIFRKDARQFWPEIAVSLAIAAALVWVLPMQWNGPVETVWGANNKRTMDVLMMGRGLSVLLAISWVMLVVRAVHAEGLVGDRQFWLTRPYEWKSLLAAKALFVAAFVVLPLVVVQCLLMLRAGLNPMASVGDLAFNLLLIVGMLVLPLVAIATVTADFTKMTLTLLGVVLGVGALVFVISMHVSFPVQGPLLGSLIFTAIGDPFLPSRDLVSTGHHSQLPIALLLLAVSAPAVVVQYARRRTGISRTILLALPVALTVLVLLTAHGSGTPHPFSDPTYAPLAAGATPPVELTYAPDEKHPFYVSKGENPVGVRIPLRVSGLASDRAVIAEAYPKVTIMGADGFEWSENTSEFYPEKFVPTSRRTHDGFNIPRTIYDRLKTGPVTIALSFALTDLQATKSVRMAMPMAGQDVSVPEYGICSRMDMNRAIITCRSALKEPPLTYASADWQETPCAVGQTELEQVRGDYWAGMLDADPAEFGISPILFTSLSFMPDLNNATGGKYLCSGSMITFTQYRLVGRVQTTLTIPNFNLPED
jgi:hypothetical protein